MRFHGLMLLRDEGDVIGETLTALLEWIDVLHIHDLGSTDTTWDIVQDFAGRDSRIRPFKREPTVYQDSLRCVMFDRLRGGFEAGDWVLKLDGDEFYPYPPPQFVRERLRPWESMVYLQWYFFRLTVQEAGAYLDNAVSIEDDRKRSIRERRRFYKVPPYSEPRCFRYRPTMQWPSFRTWPYNAGFVARERLPILHYPHRDPVQLQRRSALRSAIKQRNKLATGGHWDSEDWRNELVETATGVSLGALKPMPEGLAATAGVDNGPLLFWEPGADLPEVRLYHHTAPPIKRACQRLAHTCLLPFLDRLRPAYDKNYTPEVLSAQDNIKIGAACAGGQLKQPL